MKLFNKLSITVKDLLIDINEIERLISAIELAGVEERIRGRMELGLEETMARMRSMVAEIGSISLPELTVGDIEKHVMEVKRYSSKKSRG